VRLSPSLSDVLRKSLLKRGAACTADAGGKLLLTLNSITTFTTIAKVMFKLCCLPCSQLTKDVLREEMLVIGPVYVW
jgi:hypothetical protein